MPEHERHIVEREQLSCLKMDIWKISLLRFFCFELLLSQVTSFYVFSLFHLALTPPTIPRMELISSPIKILLPTTLPKVSGRSEEKVFHSTEKLLFSCLHIFLLKIFEGSDLTKVKINSQTQRFALKAVYGLKWQAWIHLRFPGLALWNWRGNELSRALGQPSVLAVPGQVLPHFPLILQLCSPGSFL